MDSPGPTESANKASVETSAQRLEGLFLCGNPHAVEDDKKATDGLSQLRSTEAGSSPAHPYDQVSNQPTTLTPNAGCTPSVDLVHRVTCGSDVCCVCVNSSGKLFAAGCEQFTYVYFVETGKRLWKFDHGDKIYIKSLSFSLHGNLLAAGDSKGIIRICNMEDGSYHDWVPKPITNYPDTYHASVHFSPGGDRLVSGGIDEKVRIWDVAQSKVARVFEAEKTEDLVHAVAVSHKYIAAGLAAKGGVRVWNIESGDKVADLAGADGHTGSVFSVALDGDCVFSASLDGTVKEWHLNIAGGDNAPFKGAKCVRTCGVHGFALSVALMSDWVLSCSGREILLRHRRIESVEMRLNEHEKEVISVDGNSEHRLIVSGSQDGTVCVWRLGARSWTKSLESDGV